MSESKPKNINDSQSANELPTVVVTGFGLFRNYKLNPSWESVKRVNLKNVNLIIKEIPVAYEDVDEIVSEIWSQYKPLLVVHCGVSCMAHCITIETRAINDRALYTKPDIYGKIPNDPKDKANKVEDENNVKKENKCEKVLPNDSIDCIKSEICLENVCKKIDQKFKEGLIKMPAILSTNAGRYLCEYIFYSSLKQDSRRTAFIHVPELSDQRSLEDIASSLEFTIKYLIEEMIHFDNSITK